MFTFLISKFNTYHECILKEWKDRTKTVIIIKHGLTNSMELSTTREATRC
jgi:hypothetical protein